MCRAGCQWRRDSGAELAAPKREGLEEPRASAKQEQIIAQSIESTSSIVRWGGLGVSGEGVGEKKHFGAGNDWSGEEN